MDDNDPRTAIFAFLDGLPQTIRTEALLYVTLYAMEGSIYVIGSRKPKAGSDFSTEVESYLMRSGGAGISAVICSVAAIDLLFGSLIARLNQAEAALAMLTNRDPENLGFQQSHLSLPLRRRHWEQASATWNDLRTTKLSPQSILDFAGNQQTPQPRQ